MRSFGTWSAQKKKNMGFSPIIGIFKWLRAKSLGVLGSPQSPLGKKMTNPHFFCGSCSRFTWLEKWSMVNFGFRKRCHTKEMCTKYLYVAI